MPRRKSNAKPNHCASAAGAKVKEVDLPKNGQIFQTMRNMRRALPAFCFSLLALCCISAQAQEKTEGDSNGPVSDKVVQSVFYKAQHQETGNMWDVWLFHHEGTYFLYYLANVGEHRWRWDNISMATSPDGVHWTEKGPILKKTPGAKWMGPGSTWKSPAFEKDGKFYMNYSEEIDGRQNIYFAESTGLLHRTRLKGEEYRFVQNEQCYEKKGRWDCIWTFPKPGGGLYGYWTAGPKRSEKNAADGLFGFGESLDGVHWKALAPPRVIDDEEKGEVGVGDQRTERSDRYLRDRCSREDVALIALF